MSAHINITLEHVGGRHQHVLAGDLGMPAAVLVAEHRQAAHPGEAGGRLWAPVRRPPAVTSTGIAASCPTCP
jgi:hypothetical protein